MARTLVFSSRRIDRVFSYFLGRNTTPPTHCVSGSSAAVRSARGLRRDKGIRVVNRGSTELGVSLRPIRSKFSLLRVVRLPEFAGLRPVRVVAGLRAVVLPRPPFETDELLPRICGRVVAGLWHPISVAALCSVVNLVVRGGALFGGAGILRLGTLDWKTMIVGRGAFTWVAIL